MYIALIFSGVSYSAYAINKGTEKALPNILYPLLIIFLKHTLNLLISSLIDNYIDISFDLPVTFMLMIVDILIVALVWILADRKAKLHFVKLRKLVKASKHLAGEYDKNINVFPFNGFFNIKNPMLASVFFGALITTSSMILQRAYADIFVLGVPSSFFEIAEMIVSYLLDLLIGLAGYATSYFALSYVFLREE
jgi:hypothetical protein